MWPKKYRFVGILTMIRVALNRLIPLAPRPEFDYVLEPVHPGGQAKLEIKVPPNTVVSATVKYKSAKRYLKQCTAGPDGKILCAWQVPPNTKCGDWKVSIDCSPGGHKEIPFRVIK